MPRRGSVETPRATANDQQVMMESIPSVLSFLICDSVIIDELTKKKTVVGVFDNLQTPTVPVAARIGLFARLTDMEGTYKLTIKVVLLGGEEKLIGFAETSEYTMTDRLGMMDVALNLPPVRFPEFGRYEFELFANAVYVGRATMSVVKTKVGE